MSKIGRQPISIPAGITVSVAATGDGAPWELTWERAGTTWRLTAASRVLQ